MVLWISLGLVSIALYFSQDMMFNLRAADNYEAGIESERAIESATRYVCFVLSNLQQQVQTQSQGANMAGVLLQPGSLQVYSAQSGTTPYTQNHQAEEVTVGAARFWFIGRDPSCASNTTSTVPVFGLVDEASKLNLNTATYNMISALPFMTLDTTSDLAANIIAWRGSSTTNTTTGSQLEYGMLTPPYNCKIAPFETLDEIKLVIGITTDVLYGADINMNGILDSNETTQAGQTLTSFGENLDNNLNAGILEYTTIYTREPNRQPDGTARINVNNTNTRPLQTLLQNALGNARAALIIQKAAITPRTVCTSVLEYYVRSGMTADEFTKVYDSLTTTNAPYISGLININTAPGPVLACIPGIGSTNAQTVVTYRQGIASDQLATTAWLVDAIGKTAATQAGPYVTAKSYQFRADIAAVGHHGRGYRRAIVIIDTSDGSPHIVYRRDITQFPWALGDVRKTWQLLGNL